ncbi:MAG: sterol desaturase family protein [Devosia sp.]|nr:sterol desaturase family protein [Devosia sp.]
MILYDIALVAGQAAVVFVVSTTIFDILHYLLHRWEASRSRLLRAFSRMHWVHHRFLNLEMQIDPAYRWQNIWCHVVPEYVTSMAGTLAFLLIFPWPPVAIIAALRTWYLLSTLKEEGMDFNHMSMDRVSARQGLWWVDANYHAMHHLFPNQFFSSFANVFDLLFGTACQIEGRTFIVTGASGAFGKAMSARIIRKGGEVRALKSGRDFGPGDYDRAREALEWADVLILAHGAKTADCWDANYVTFVDLIDLFIEVGKNRVLPPEIWALGSEAELHGDFGQEDMKDYVASKRAFAARARGYYANPMVIYRHIVPSAFTSAMGRGLMSADTAAAIAIFFIRRAFRYVPVTYTTLAFWNYFRFKRQPNSDSSSALASNVESSNAAETTFGAKRTRVRNSEASQAPNHGSSSRRC